TVAYLGTNSATVTGSWIELEFWNGVDASKVILDTDNKLEHCVSVVAIQYWDSHLLDWKVSSYFRNINNPSSRFVSYATAQYILADDDDTGVNNLAYSLRSIEFAPVFDVDSSTGYIKRNVSTIDYETQNHYELQVDVRDSGNLLSVTTVTVWIVDVNEAPMLADNSVLQVSETVIAGKIVGSINAYDPENEDFVLTIVDGNHLSAFSINNMNELVLSHGILDYETYPTYSLKLLIKELRDVNPLSAYGYVTVNVLNDNEAPP
ncbi:Protocadherin Fat-like protein, partial [Phytophthora palmivora]